MLKNTKILLGIASVYTLILLYFSLGNVNAVLPDPVLKHQDKLLHFLAYIVLAFVWGLFAKSKCLTSPLLVSFLATLAFGIVLETVQELINSLRTTHIFDGIANCFGVVIGTLIVKCYQKSKVKIV